MAAAALMATRSLISRCSILRVFQPYCDSLRGMSYVDSPRQVMIEDVDMLLSVGNP